MTYLAINWTTSRGRDTYGYNLVSLTDTDTGRRYRTCGGGYDMTGTVLGDWLENRYQSELIAYVASRTASLADCGYNVPGYRRLPDLYGMTVRPDGRIELDGACGESCMVRVAEAIGLTVRSVGHNRGRRWHHDGYTVDAVRQAIAA
jgi:hypothetical protein